MKKNILAMGIAAMFLTTSVLGQVSAGFKGGISFTNIANDQANTRVTAHGGVFLHASLSRDWGIQPELLYAGMGDKFLLIPQGTTRLALEYVQVPVMFQYFPAKIFYLELGPQLGILTNARLKYSGGGADGVTSAYNTADFALNFGMGLWLNRNVGFYGRYNLGITNVVKNSNISYQNRGVQLGLALKMRR